MKYKSLKSCLKKSPVAIDINICEDTPSCCEQPKCCEPMKCYEVQKCCEPEICCEQRKSCETCCCKTKPCSCPCESACCKPGCSPRMPCVCCIKRGVKCQIPIPSRCRKQCVSFNECPKPLSDCPKKVTIKTRCEIKKDECQEVIETDCCCQKCPRCIQKSCKEVEVDPCDIIDYCKMARDEGSDCKTSCTKKSNSCKNFKHCPCTSCKSNKCEKSCSIDNDDEKCCECCCKTRNSCKTSKQVQECSSKNSSCMSSDCPKPCDNFVKNYCNEEVDEKCTVYEQGDCMSYHPMPDANYCGPQKLTQIPSTCLPSVGSFCVPHISQQTPVPCPCGSRSCGNSILIFQQAIQSPPCITAKRFL